MKTLDLLELKPNEYQKPKKAQHSITENSESIVTRKEIGGSTGPDPTRYGDWEVNGRCTDF